MTGFYSDIGPTDGGTLVHVSVQMTGPLQPADEEIFSGECTFGGVTTPALEANSTSLLCRTPESLTPNMLVVVTALLNVSGTLQSATALQQYAYYEVRCIPCQCLSHAAGSCTRPEFRLHAYPLPPFEKCVARDDHFRGIAV